MYGYFLQLCIHPMVLWDSHGTEPLEEYYPQDGWFMLVRKFINILVAQAFGFLYGDS